MNGQYIDLQVNGFGGVDFSDPGLTRPDVERAFRGVLARGTAAFLPTMITSPPDVYRRNLPMIVDVMQEDRFRGRVLGVHLEGPFISAAPGAVGAHNPAYVQLPNEALLTALLDLGRGRVRLLTLAAEIAGAEALARLAVDRGVAVSIGHSLFTMADLDRLHSAGARSLTHLGNGLPNLLPRHPNPLWDGLAHDGYTAMLIADGHHLPPSVLRVSTRAKGYGRVVVVSDASPVAGLPPGEYDVLGNRAILETSGRFYNPERQCLVGSSAMMADCVAFLEEEGIFEGDAITQVAVINPLRLIGMELEDVQWASVVNPI